MNYYETDPEFMERFEHFAFDEVVNEESRQLEPKTRYLVVLAALIGCQGEAAYREILPKALEAGLSPVAVKETVYQAVDYLGMGRMWQFLRAANEILRRMRSGFRSPRRREPPWKTGWKKACRYRPLFSENR